MAFAEDASVPCRNDDPQRAPVFEPQDQRLSDQRYIANFEICGSFDPVQTRDRQAVAGKHRLITRNRVVDTLQDDILLHQVTGPRQLLDQFEGLVLHPSILPITEIAVSCPKSL